MKSDFVLQVTIACSWGVVIVALSVLSVLGIGDRENVLGVLCGMLALGAFAAVHVFRKNTRERKSLEHALGDCHRQYRHLVERFPGAIIVFEEGRALYANLAGARLLGAGSTDEILGKDLLECFDARESARISSIVANFEGTSTVPKEHHLVRKDGTPLDVEIETSRVFRDGKELARIFIAERMPAEAVRQAAATARPDSACLERLMVS